MPRKTYNSGDPSPASQKWVKELLRQGDTVQFTAFGPSMKPLIRSGESIEVRPLQPNDLRPGCILLFRHHGRLVLHRLVRKCGDELWMRGDAGLGAPDKIRKKQAIGVATVRYRRGKRFKLDTGTARFWGIVWHKVHFLRLFYAFWRFPRRPSNPF